MRQKLVGHVGNRKWKEVWEKRWKEVWGAAGVGSRGGAAAFPPWSKSGEG